MKFYTHGSVSKTKYRQPIDILEKICFSLIFSLFIFMAIACSLYIRSIAPAIVLLLPMSLANLYGFISDQDMKRAYIEIHNNTICVVDYYFGVKKEKVFSIQDIINAESLPSSSFSVRGYRWPYMTRYIVFRGHNGKFLFKVLHIPETESFFHAYLNEQ